jgi:glucosamine-6-phosphate deaminase
MKVSLAQGPDQAVDIVISRFLDRIESNPHSVLGLATGVTMIPVYRGIVNGALERGINLRECFFFMLDEYVGIDPSHPGSFRSYIELHFKGPLKLRSDQFAFPPIHLIAQNKAGSHYEELLVQAGGIDLQLLGIGVNGHVGFNEPGPCRNSRTRVVKLSDETLKVNQLQFGLEQMPREALSMGVATIMEARELVMLATGKSKAPAIKYLFNHHDDESCPASFLKSHPHFTLVLDPEAASKISLNI